MTCHLVALCFDATDPRRLGAFWAGVLRRELVDEEQRTVARALELGRHIWSEALGWPLVWDQDQETAIQSPNGGTKITWGGPPVPAKNGKNRLHFDIAPPGRRRPAG